MPKILVCDDDQEMRYLLRCFMELKGISVIEATNGKEAVERLRSEQVDAVLLDLLMPIQDGFSVLQQLREDPATRSLPVVVLSSLGDEESRLRALREGASDFVKKPFNPEELTMRVIRLLQSG
jgi:CheY-like chemotaxis protein